jgi:hypothetical protein
MHEDNARQLQEMGARYDEATPYFNNHRPVAFDDDLSWATASIASNIGPLITIENGVPSFA